MSLEVPETVEEEWARDLGQFDSPANRGLGSAQPEPRLFGRGGPQ